MRLLLDTHAFLWFINGDDNLSQHSQLLIQDTNNEVLISIATLWEISIKSSLKKLELAQSFEILIPKELINNKFTLLPITVEHLIQLGKLPLHHRDPFDRILIAQSLCEQLPIVSKDSQFNNYSLEIIW
ncbi:type II toxin-antitoxin system VapC family toxin [Beggiatoa leptomitoformis]|uniref:PIN domain-containing protein n=1 Tax=Beggiatoa leptomitoformis TaxID=288004 RepID=A0A2N9YD03_9GAMM|nr:type II toxin-antitoxin system VapC family toxin [Beggiatoa leptomitoformis]ALG69233.1 PIN domain-containing protein [Beggiatoa leptomitoformis]AUI68331.1 PIN domain-containing protein [Beggiatoa leptomitoformis]